LKRKIKKLINESRHSNVFILRDISDERYPYTGDETLKGGRFLWRPCSATRINHDGLGIVIRDHFAYYNYEHQQWDFASRFDFSTPSSGDENPWHDQAQEADRNDLDQLRMFWRSLPRGSQQHIIFEARLGYDEIIEIDDAGDDVVEMPTIFVNFKQAEPPLSDRCKIFFQGAVSLMGETLIHPEGHVRVFPDRFRDLEWEQEWFARNEFDYATEPHEISASDRSDIEIPD
jgi:hypothetical protein